MKVVGPARLVVAWVPLALAGCSLLYNPSDLPAVKGDAGAVIPPDSPIDTDRLRIDTAGPATLFEGQGAGGSRPAILVLRGLNIGPDATVALVPTDPAAATPMLQIDNDHAVRSAGGGMLAVPVTLPVDTASADTSVLLTIQVTQTGKTGPVMVQLAGQLTLSTLPELDVPLAASRSPAPWYSRIQIAGDQTFAPVAAGAAQKLRSKSSISIGKVHSDASGITPGAGGAAGGGLNQAGGGPCGGKPGAVVGLVGATPDAGLLVAGSGAGFATVGGAGTGGNAGGSAFGDSLITTYAGNYACGGGGGTASVGGGGGGTVELTAMGTLSAGAITANGGNGGNGGNLAGGAGGGAGGVIVLRAGSTATLGALAVAGGAGGTGGLLTPSPGGTGASGRMRIDAPVIAGTQPSFSSATRRGVQFTEDNPLITADPHLPLNVISAVSSDAFQVFVFDASERNTFTTTLTFGAASAAINPLLGLGYNRVCVTPPGSNAVVDESTNCLEIAYVP